MSSTGPRKLFKEMTTATSGVLARFPLIFPFRNSCELRGPRRHPHFGPRTFGGGGNLCLCLCCIGARLRCHPQGPKTCFKGMTTANVICILYSVICLRGNGVIRRTQKVIQGDDNGHVGRPCEVSPAPPCPELFCELRGLCRHSCPELFFIEVCL